MVMINHDEYLIRSRLARFDLEPLIDVVLDSGLTRVDVVRLACWTWMAVGRARAGVWPRHELDILLRYDEALPPAVRAAVHDLVLDAFASATPPRPH